MQFGGLNVSYKDAEIAILPVPYEGTVTYRKGTWKGPEAIISASVNVETYEFLTGYDYSKIKAATLEEIEPGLGTPENVVQKIEKRVTEILSDGKMPFIFGGEHSVTPPAVRAVAAMHDIGVVQIDAHADLRDKYGGTKHSHACTMARVRETAPAVQIGIRSCSIEEGERIKREGLAVLGVDETLEGGNFRRALDALPGKVYLTIDVDGIDPSIMPSTGTPEPGGFNWKEITRIVRTVGETKKIVCADIVELSPIEGLHAPDFVAARLAFCVLAEMADMAK